jgi:hypothetical protein
MAGGFELGLDQLCNGEGCMFFNEALAGDASRIMPAVSGVQNDGCGVGRKCKGQKRPEGEQGQDAEEPPP